jgi:hypothetical protein
MAWLSVLLILLFETAMIPFFTKISWLMYLQSVKDTSWIILYTYIQVQFFHM